MLVRSSGVRWLCRLLACLPLSLAAEAPAMARLTVHFKDVAGGVVMTGSGSLDISAWPVPQPLRVTLSPGGSGSSALIVTGFQRGVASEVDVYFGIPINGFGGFGGRSFLPASRSSGDPLALALLSGAAYLPVGYTSRQPLLSELQWDRTSLAAMGLTPGRLTYDWTTVRGTDQVEVLVGPLPAPGPAPLLGLPLAWGLARRWRRLRLGLQAQASVSVVRRGNKP